MSVLDDIKRCLQERILILDGAMGTRIQAMDAGRESFHCGLFAHWPVSLVGNNDVLNITAPQLIQDIHRRYIEAGADIITTNTFSANRISQHEYQCENEARQMAFEGARIARQVADAFRGEQPSALTDGQTPDKKQPSARKVWVAGSMGPTSKSLSLSPDINQPAQRAVSFDDMAAAYREQAEALLEGGADLLLIETCFDALNTKAALYAVSQLGEQRGETVPVMVSATINDRSGRTLTGQTLEAFYVSIAHYPILSFGLNCSFGVKELRPFVAQLTEHIPTYLSIYPNAGLPNEMGEYEELPEVTSAYLRQMAEAGLLNIAGGCCGTDEHHIRAISDALRGLAPRPVPAADHRLWVSGLEPVLIDREATNFTNVGERTNVAGSRKFARLIAEKKYDEAMSVARHQIEGGAAVIDINMDDAMLDSRQEMQTFVRYISNDPSVARSALMIDSSDWPTILAGLKNAQGKCIVNSISLKNGEDDFLAKARELLYLGAAVVVMAFDEEGQATTYERKIAVAQRAYRLLTDIGFPPQDIIIDVNILSVGTGISEHQNYGIDFIRAVEWIKQHLPYAKTSGGVSNLSFAFRGNNKVREAMHSAFLYHAIRAGLDMAIVNPAMLQVYDAIEPTLLKAVEDVILNTDAEATDRLLQLAATLTAAPGSAASGSASGTAATGSAAAPTVHAGIPGMAPSVEARLTAALTKGLTDTLPADIAEALEKYDHDPVRVIEEPLMQALEHVGRLFGEGKMFLPQVVKSAQVMKDAVALLQPYMADNERAVAGHASKRGNPVVHDHSAGAAGPSRPVIITATANGDVHDIGKNIVGIVLGCNNFDVRDLGVMVPGETILAETQRLKPCLVGISGLITPSLKEMEHLCRLFQQAGLRVPIVVGGATTSAVHTAVKLAPLYDGLVVYGGDASQTSLLAKKLQISPDETISQIKSEQQQVREAYEEHHAPIVSYAEANRRGAVHSSELPSDTSINLKPQISTLKPETINLKSQLSTLKSLIDWRMFLLFWGFKGETLQQLLVNPEAEKTLREGKEWLEKAFDDDRIEVLAQLRYDPVRRRDNDLVFEDGSVMPMLRSQSAAGHYRSLADYYDEEQPRPLGLFTVVARPVENSIVQEFKGSRVQELKVEDSGEKLMSHAICARLAEAAAEWLQSDTLSLFPAGSQPSVLRVAFGYATCPDHSLKRIVFDRLHTEQQLGITLTDHYSIQPSTAICGLFIVHPEARYFPVGMIDRDQLQDYCLRRGITLTEGERLLSKYVKSL